MSEGVARDRAEAVVLEVPAESVHVATVRVVAASLAADGGFDLDRIADVRLAVGEAASAMVDRGRGERLVATFIASADCLDIELRVHGADAPDDVVVDDLARQILRAVTTAVQFGAASVTMRIGLAPG